MLQFYQEISCFQKEFYIEMQSSKVSKRIFFNIKNKFRKKVQRVCILILTFDKYMYRSVQVNEIKDKVEKKA